MRIIITAFLLFFIQSFSIAQPSLTIKGTVIDAENKNPIALANIGIPAKNIGSASRLDGSFSINLPQETQEDTLQISAIGYQAKTYPVTSLLDSNKVTFNLTPKVYQMPSVVVTDRKRNTKWIGKKIRPIWSASLGISTHPDRLGAAFAFKVHWNKGLPTQVLYTRIFLKRNTDTPVFIRCGLAGVDPKTGLPSQNLIPKTVDITTNTKKGWATCDFREQNLYLHSKEFFVVFEWLTPQDDRVIPMIATNPFFKSDTYIRHHSLAEWEKSSSDLIYSLKVSY